MKNILITGFICVTLVACASHEKQQIAQNTTQSSAAKTVNFPVSCSEQARSGIEYGLTLTHHMMYVEAEKEFNKVIDYEPECAMAHWGVAITLFHPLWPGQTRDAALQKGWDAIVTAKNIKPVTAKESGYINATQAFYINWQTRTHKQRIAAWAAEQKKLYQTYLDDTEAAVLYALSHLANAPKADPAFEHQKQAGALLEKLNAKYPGHPGILHYTIHAYDNPLLAKRALNAANAYDKIAPEVPHALHMPTHIYVRLGAWDKVIELNARSAQAALNYPANGRISHHNPHALDYQVYAHLQKGEYEQAQSVLNRLQETDNYQQTFVSGYALAAIPARMYLEQQQWDHAEQLAVRKPSSFPWEKYPEVEAITYFARGLGAARQGNVVTTKSAINKINAFYRQTGQSYWAVILDAQRKTLMAWLEYQQGNLKTALNLMSEAATLEDSVNKHPVTPGAVLPARELYAEMLLLTGDYGSALKNYRVSLEKSPNRLNSSNGLKQVLSKLGRG